MYRMFVDKKKLARQRLVKFLIVTFTTLAFLIALLAVIIIIYGEKKTIEADIGNADLEEPVAESVSPQENPPLAPVPYVSKSAWDSVMVEKDTESSGNDTEASDSDMDSGDAKIPEPPDVPPIVQEEVKADETPEVSPEQQPQIEVQEQEKPQDEPSINKARQSGSEVYTAAKNWWQGLAEDTELSDDFIINNFISNFNLVGAETTTFEVSATNIEIHGTYNDGRFVVNVIFAGNGSRGVYFVAWYGGENPYCAVWQTGDADVQVKEWDGVPPKAVF